MHLSALNFIFIRLVIIQALNHHYFISLVKDRTTELRHISAKANTFLIFKVCQCFPMLEMRLKEYALKELWLLFIVLKPTDSASGMYRFELISCCYIINISERAIVLQ